MKSEIIPEWKDGRLKIEFIAEVHLDKSYSKEMLKKITARIESMANMGVKKTLLKSGADVFSIGKNIRGKYPELYKNSDMRDILKNSFVEIEITCQT